ncbi:MAG: glycine betaine ABC transporter substrate-binding protein [Rhodothermales bacterium]
MNLPCRRFGVGTCVGGWLVVLISLLPSHVYGQSSTINIGSKKFTESVILGEIATQLLVKEGFEAAHKSQLGGTAILWNGLLSGELDIYPDYTGTLIQEVLAVEQLQSFEELVQSLDAKGIKVTAPLGFNNTYAIGMREARGAELGISTISDLRSHPELKGGFSNEFMDRGDGWPGLRDAYGLPHQQVRGLDHDLAYRALESDDIEMMDLYSTDAEIQYYNIRILEDDQQFFPEYQSVILYRADLEARYPGAEQLLKKLEQQIDEAGMTRLNALAKLDKIPETQVAASYLNETFFSQDNIVVEEVTRWDRIWQATAEHLWLVLISLGAAILLAIPLGIVAARYAKLGQLILGIVGVIYTIPSLALLVFMIPLLGIGGPPALVALFLYSLLPIVRNTHAGLTDIPQPLLESAEALGLSPVTKLLRIELPLASRSILAGIKTSAIINIGTATLGALIGAGGYGQPILTGIRLDDTSLILEGAIPAAVLAMVAQLLFEGLERVIIPKGLRQEQIAGH